MPLPDDRVLKSIEDLYSKLKRIQTLLTDAEITSVRLVVNPEKMVIKEAQRSFTYFNLYGYFTDLIICNRLLPDRVKDKVWNKVKYSQHGIILYECRPRWDDKTEITEMPIFKLKYHHAKKPIQP